MNTSHFAEIIHSSLYQWTGQSWRWNYFPSFGSLVVIRTGQTTLYGMVTQITTGSKDPSRAAYAWQKTEEELMHEQPQIFEFLQTLFTCIPLGYEDNGRLVYQVPPQPPKIHSFIAHATQKQAATFFSQPHYVSVLFNKAPSLENFDELLLAVLNNHQQNGILSPEHLAQFVDMFYLLTGNDYRRLKIFLQRVQQITTTQTTPSHHLPPEL